MAPENEFITRAEFAAVLNGLPNTVKLAVMAGVEEMIPKLMDRVDEKYERNLNEVRKAVFGDGTDESIGMKIKVDRLEIIAKDIPDLVKFRWIVGGIVIASNAAVAIAVFLIEHFWK